MKVTLGITEIPSKEDFYEGLRKVLQRTPQYYFCEAQRDGCGDKETIK